MGSQAYDAPSHHPVQWKTRWLCQMGRKGIFMMIQRLVERVQSTKVLTSSLSNQISQLLWKREYDSADMAALGELLDALESGDIAEN